MATPESIEIVRWLTELVDATRPLPLRRPAPLDGAVLRGQPVRPDRRVWLVCPDGAEYVVCVVPLGYTKEALKRRQASGEERREREAVLRKALAGAFAAHRGHAGPIERCRRGECKGRCEIVLLFGGSAEMLRRYRPPAPEAAAEETFVDFADELAWWLAGALDTAAPLPERRPASLDGAAVSIPDDPYTTIPNLRIVTAAGERTGVMAMHVKLTEAQREEAGERHRTLTYQREIREIAAETEALERERHARRHEGPFESCADESCRMVREGAAGLKADF